MNILTEGFSKVCKGENFYINFEERTMKVGNKKLIERGEYDETQELYQKTDDFFNTVEKLYENYKYSLPSERSDNKRRKYFKALSVDELTDEQLICGQEREQAQYMLEAFILCAIVNGDFVWDEETMDKWFWQSTLHPDLIILKQWTENK